MNDNNPFTSDHPISMVNVFVILARRIRLNWRISSVSLVIDVISPWISNQNTRFEMICDNNQLSMTRAYTRMNSKSNECWCPQCFRDLFFLTFAFGKFCRMKASGTDCVLAFLLNNSYKCWDAYHSFLKSSNENGYKSRIFLFNSLTRFDWTCILVSSGIATENFGKHEMNAFHAAYYELRDYSNSTPIWTYVFCQTNSQIHEKSMMIASKCKWIYCPEWNFVHESFDSFTLSTDTCINSFAHRSSETPYAFITHIVAQCMDKWMNRCWCLISGLFVPKSVPSISTLPLCCLLLFIECAVEWIH